MTSTRDSLPAATGPRPTRSAAPGIRRGDRWRSGARRYEISERLCPPEGVESVSDLSAQALYYYGKDDLKHRFIVIGEQQGRQGSEYPLRELISRRSITKAVPMKDAVTGQVKTETITVNGPIALVETTTSGDVHPENLSRCFVVGIDESEEQTRRILEEQRRAHTVDGYLEKRRRRPIEEKHHCVQRLLEPDRYWQVVARLRDYCDFLVARGLILLSPLPDRAVPRYQRSSPSAPARQGFPALLDRVRTGRPFYIKGKAIMEVAYSSALRPREVYCLELGDVDATSGQLFIRQSKGRKDVAASLGRRADPAPAVTAIC